MQNRSDRILSSVQSTLLGFIIEIRQIQWLPVILILNRLHINLNFGVRYTCVMLCRADAFMAEHLPDSFHWNTISKGNCSSKCMARNIQTFGYCPLSQHK